MQDKGYNSVKRSLLKDIIEGRFAEGKLPRRIEMATMYNTTISTCTKAVAELVSEGRLRTVSGVGTFANDVPIRHPLYFLIHSLKQPLYMQTAKVLSEMAPKYGFSPTFIIETGACVEEEPNILRKIYSDPQAFVAFYSIMNSKSLPIIQRNGSRTIVYRFGDSELKGKVSRLSFNRAHGESLAAEYLVQLGHKRIAHILTCATPHYNGNFQNALGIAGIRQNKRLVIRLPKWDISANSEHWAMVQKSYERIMALSNRPTAVFCHNNQLGIMFAEYCIKMGMKVPDEISIVGYEGQLLQEHASIKLTSAGPSIEKIADWTFRKMLNNCLPIEDIEFPCELFLGETSAPPL